MTSPGAERGLRSDRADTEPSIGLGNPTEGTDPLIYGTKGGVNPESSVRGDDPLPLIENATHALRSERRELEDERAAFERFSERLKALDAAPVSGRTPTLLADRSQPTLEKLREAYVESVMSVPHFDDVYGESYRESLARELNEELAVAIATAEGLSPQLQRSLEDCVEQAIDGRESLIEFVETELETLASMGERLDEVVRELESILAQPLDEAGFYVLASSRSRLRSLEERCGDLLDERQAHVQREYRVSVAEIDDAARCLYGGCETTHPVLAAIGIVCARLDDARRALERRLAFVG